jgi:hypothetical protein
MNPRVNPAEQQSSSAKQTKMEKPIGIGSIFLNEISPGTVELLICNKFHKKRRIF